MYFLFVSNITYQLIRLAFPIEPQYKGDVRIYVKRHRPGRRLFGFDTAVSYKYYIHVP